MAPTRDELLARHPWPKEHAAAPRLEWMWTFEVPLGTLDVWRVISDSSRMNRSLGVSEMKFEERGAVRWGTSRPAGVRHEWIEVPWSWVAGQWITSLRVYDRGFSRAVYAVFEIAPDPADASRTLRTSRPRPSTMRAKALPSVS